MMKKCPWRVFLALLIAAPMPVAAERFLTIPDAHRLCYAEADRFEARTVVFTPAQVKAVQAASRQRVLNKGNRAWLAWKGTNLLGVLMVDHVPGKHEIIDYAVAITPQGAVERIEILEYRESHGGEIRGANWRAQFKGRNSQSRLRLNEDVYNISGATISCRNVTDGVRRLLATFDLVLRPGLPPAPGPGPQRVSLAPPGTSERP